MGPISHLPVLLSAKGGHVSFISRYIYEGGTKNPKLFNFKGSDREKLNSFINISQFGGTN